MGPWGEKWERRERGMGEEKKGGGGGNRRGEAKTGRGEEASREEGSRREVKSSGG